MMMPEKENIWNLPNVLTMLRMALIGVFIWLFVTGNRYLALAVFLFAGATDFLDGYIARKRHIVTSFGKLMDPLADKLMLITALACLTAEGLVPLWVILVTVGKELFMIVGAFLMLRKRDIVVHSVMIGKVASVAFIVAVFATFLHEYTAPVDTYLQIAAVALTIAAMVWYLVQALRTLK